MKYRTDKEKLEAFERVRGYNRQYAVKRRKEHPEKVAQSMIRYWSKQAEQAAAGKENDNETK